MELQNDIDKIREENRKRPIEAKVQEIDLVDSESFFNKSKSDKESRRGGYHSRKKDDPVNEWLESADNENTLTIPDETEQTKSGRNQAQQSKSGQNQEPSSDLVKAADRDIQLPPLNQQSSSEVNEISIENGKASVSFPRSKEPMWSSHAREIVANSNHMTEPLINISTHVLNTIAEQEAAYYPSSLAYSKNFFVAPEKNVVDSGTLSVPSTAALLNTTPVLNLAIPVYTPHPTQNAAKSVNAQFKNLTQNFCQCTYWRYHLASWKLPSVHLSTATVKCPQKLSENSSVNANTSDQFRPPKFALQHTACIRSLTHKYLRRYLFLHPPRATQCQNSRITRLHLQWSTPQGFKHRARLR